MSVPATGSLNGLSVALKEGYLDLFVGAGASQAAKLPGWDALINEMKEAILTHSVHTAAEVNAFLVGADHLDIAEQFRADVGDFQYFKFLRDRFRVDVPLSRLHHEIRRWPVTNIFTTNWDRLLEKTLRPLHGVEPLTVVFPEQLGYIDGNSVKKIVKLHGDIDHPGSIVLTRKDYSEYFSRHRDFERELSSSINNRTLLFIGFSLRDPNFTRIYSDARSFFDRTKREAYALMAGTNAIERDLWSADGLRIYPVKKHAQIPSLLKQIRLAAGVI
jgi:hypothetical protein